MYLCYSLKSLKERQKRQKKVINVGQERVLENIAAHTSTIGEGIGTEKEFGPNWYQEKTRGLWTDVVLYINEDEEQDEGLWGRNVRNGGRL